MLCFLGLLSGTRAFHAPIPIPAGIVVGNAQAELVHWLVNQPQSGKIVYADAEHADGIIEGLARHSLY